jgi:parallel beta helix pectate lyase-like protein
MAVNATAVWRVRTSGNNLNGGGFDSGIAGAGTDYSQQNAAQASGSAGTATGTATFVDATANAFTSAMVGNALWIASGAGFTVSAYFVVGFTSASTVTLDRSPGTGTVAAWKLGGGWADYWTNINTNNPTVGSNLVYVLGTGIPNPASYVYDYVQNVMLTLPGLSANLTFACDPATPNYKAAPDTTGGMPCIQISGALAPAVNGGVNNNRTIFSGLWRVFSAAGQVWFENVGNASIFNSLTVDYGCVLDQFGFDTNVYAVSTSNSGLGYAVYLIGSEIFSSTPLKGSLSLFGFAGYVSQGVLKIIGCNIHDVVANSLVTNAGLGAGSLDVDDTIIAKSQNGQGIALVGSLMVNIKNCTIDGHAFDGIQMDTGFSPALAPWVLMNNIISNNGSFGIECANGNTAAQNAALSVFADYNTFFNNASGDLSNFSYGPHDIHGGANPFVGQPTENYTLA